MRIDFSTAMLIVVAISLMVNLAWVSVKDLSSFGQVIIMVLVAYLMFRGGTQHKF